MRSGSSADQNFGGEEYLIVKDGADPVFDRRAFIRFNLGEIANPVSRAVLRLTVDKLPNGAPAPLKLFEASDEWNEYQMTWNNQPPFISNQLGEAVIDEKGAIEFDITSYVNAQIQGDKIASVVIIDDTLARRMIRFWSKEGRDPPTLHITQ